MDILRPFIYLLLKGIMNDKLNTKLWEGDALKAEVRIKLLEIAQHFYDYLAIEAPILDIIMTGSLANFTYHENSDIDLHIIVNYDDVGCETIELITELLKAKKDNYNLNRNIRIKGYEVELYAQDINQEHTSTGQYSVLQNKWLVKPNRSNKQDEPAEVLKLSKIYKNLIDDITKLEDDRLQLKLANTVKKDIIQKRRDGLESDGEYSTGNLLFKKLRKDEFYKLFNAISNATDRQLSLEHHSKK